MKCRGMQALHLLALEPIAEFHADKNSYGFRPKRSAADAIGACYYFRIKIKERYTMSHIKLSNNGKSPFEKLMGHAPEVLNQWAKLEEVFFRSNVFTSGFLEQIRRALAFKNLCQYCMLKAGPPDENPESVRLAIALRFANKFAIDHTSIPKREIQEMKQYFSHSELIELIAFCSFVTASQKFGSCLGLQSSDHYK
jgi:hypothetical protein